MLRRILNSLYFAGAVIGAGFIVLIAALITAQVVGREFGVQVKGVDDLTAWSVVAAGFLPLAHTYRSNGHVRVTLIVERLSGVWRRLLEGVVLGLSLFLVGFLAYSAVDMLWDSIRFEELSQNLIVIPIWIPQSSMAVGSILFTLAIVDDVVVSMRGGLPAHTSGEELPSAHGPRGG
ncbi:MAG: TRAP transporter small permease [Kiloniellales bacterium]|nr:TRAP transporter small permease [Kiloniellales bacterium]